MQSFHLRIYLLACACLFLFVHLLSPYIIKGQLVLLPGCLLFINLITTIGYGYLLAKKRAYIIDDPGQKPIGLFGSTKWLMGWLTFSILYLAGLITYHQMEAIALFPFLMTYIVFLLLLIILNSAFDDKMLFHQKQR